jgi:anti-sigma factor RsiW
VICCHELIDFLADYDEGTLSPAQRRAFEEHLVICPPCVRYIEEYREAVRLSRECLCDDCPPPLPEEVNQRLVAAMKAARGK